MAVSKIKGTFINEGLANNQFSMFNYSIGYDYNA
jgi:hypothetical protein